MCNLNIWANFEVILFLLAGILIHALKEHIPGCQVRITILCQSYMLSLMCLHNTCWFFMSSTLTISAYESVCVVHLASSLWYEIGCYSQLSNVDILYLVKQTQRMIKMSVSAMSYEPLPRDMVIEVLKLKYLKHIVNWVCYRVKSPIVFAQCMWSKVHWHTKGVISTI